MCETRQPLKTCRGCVKRLKKTPIPKLVIGAADHEFETRKNNKQYQYVSRHHEFAPNSFRQQRIRHQLRASNRRRQTSCGHTNRRQASRAPVDREDGAVNAVEALRIARRGGARLSVAGCSLVLEAETPPPPTLVDALRAHKSEVLELLRIETERRMIVEWLNAHPVASDPETCCWCGGAERSGDVLLPFGVAPTGHAWLHTNCWKPWHERRKAEALASLTSMPTFSRLGFPNDFAKNGAE